MQVLARLRAGDREIDFGVATTKAERAAVLAQRFRVYQRWGYYYEPRLRVDRDAYDAGAVYLLGRLRGHPCDGLMVGSARVVLGENRAGFRFPAQEAFDFPLPPGVDGVPVSQCHEVSRLVSERPEGIVPGTLLTPLALIEAASLYSQRVGIRCGLGVIKQRLVNALIGVGVHLRLVPAARLIYPRTSPIAGYYYHHPDPPIAVYWLGDIVPSIEQAIENYRVLTQDSVFA
jgi:hypothetical protein